MIASARKIVLQGAVQGCGLRPAMARLALRQGWSGIVRNTSAGVELIVQGDLPSEDQLRLLIADALPTSAALTECVERPLQPSLNGQFHIVESSSHGELQAHLPRDLAICPQCLAETRDPGNRRYGYPFATCAQCGPRYSILLAMPFDRERTTMREFDLCPECQREYHDPSDRRFHAQTISCPNCGPRLWLTEGGKTEVENVIETAATALRKGAVVAMRGVGGYQLLADATSSRAVNTLRTRKQRAAKPFAVLVGSSDEASRIAYLNDVESTHLASAANPIVLLRQRHSTALAPVINPRLADVGLLLPTTALHSLLQELTQRPLVCTSANREGEPLVYQVAEAESSLGDLADLFVHHDRDIEHPIDDSVVRVIADNSVTIRAARGIAPLPLSLPINGASADCYLACGSQQKNSVALCNGGQSFLAPHQGDLDSVAAQSRWEFQLREMSQLTHEKNGPAPAIICDAHPGYFATKWAAQSSAAPRPVWHHHAHIVAGMIQHGWLDREVLGVAWDGTGLGPDGTIWGGEFLISTRQAFQRVAHLRPFSLPGGEAAIKDLRRLAVAVLSQLDELSPHSIAALVHLDEQDVILTQQILNSPFSPITSSCGRLFDVAALLILNQTTADFEGYAAMTLEAACNPRDRSAYRFEVSTATPRQFDWRPVIRQILEDRRSDISARDMASRFHRGLANVIVNIAMENRSRPIVLTGGVFQNRLLVEMIAEAWPADGPPLGLPGTIPPNDGGLAAGQLAIGSSIQTHG